MFSLTIPGGLALTLDSAVPCLHANVQKKTVCVYLTCRCEWMRLSRDRKDYTKIVVQPGR